MYIHGQFKDIKEHTYTVIISDGLLTPNITIGENGLFFSDDPVNIETECDDCFTHIIKKSCTIELVTKDYMGDYLFSSGLYNIVVNVWLDDTCLFAGFVEPNIYTQPYANYYESITITCTDFLSTLEKSLLIDNTNYATLKLNSKLMTFYEYFDKIGLFTDKLDLVNHTESKVYYGGTKSYGTEKTDILKKLAVSENLFLGEDEDDLMTNEDILFEIMQYLNLHIIQEGLDFYIYDLEAIKDSNAITWYDIKTSNTMYKYYGTGNIIKSYYCSDNTNLSMSEVYNQIKVKCDITKMENVIESPLTTDGQFSKLTSDYGNYQLYMTEYMSDGEGTDALNGFVDLVTTGTTNYEAGAITNWYMQVKRNPGWKFYHKGVDLYEKLTKKDSNGEYINQWEFAKYLRENKFASCLISLGSSKKQTSKDDSPVTSVNMNDYLVISTNGKYDNSEKGLDNLSTELQKTPMSCEYVGTTSGIYSPVDENTTNYLIFSGKMVFNPLMMQTGPTWNTDYSKTTSDFSLVEDTINYGNKILLWHHTCPYGDNEDGGYYIHKFYEQTYPVKGNPVYNKANYSKMLVPFINTSKNKKLEYNYSASGDSNDKIKKLPVLECELMIGDKYCVEELVENTDGTYDSVYKWLTLSQCPTYNDNGVTKRKTTFSLGVNPAIGDAIIGKEYDIATNFDYTSNIDAKNGTAIPIKFSDNLTGNIKFRILGPINTTFNEITRRHPTWFRHTKWYENTKNILENCASIMIKEFECKIVSDNAGYQNSGDKDLVYCSDETPNAKNIKDDIEFKINTALTSEEARNLEVSNTINLSSVIDITTNKAITAINSGIDSTGASIVTAKPEEIYCDAYYNECKSPKLLVETELYDNNIKTFKKYKIGYLNKSFYPLKINRNLKHYSVNITLKEI